MPKATKKINTRGSDLKCVWGIICSLSSIDQERNNISLFNVVEEVRIPEKAAQEGKPIFFQHEVVLFWRRTIKPSIAENALITDFKLLLVDPAGAVLQEILSPLKLENVRRMRYRIQINGIPVTTSGDYVYRVQLKESDLGDFVTVLEIPLEVSLV